MVDFAIVDAKGKTRYYVVDVPPRFTDNEVKTRLVNASNVPANSFYLKRMQIRARKDKKHIPWEATHR